MSELPDAGSRWRHRKRGSSYEVIGIGQAQVSLPPDIVDGTTVVIYRDDKDGSLWARQPGEFMDGRFERLQEKVSEPSEWAMEKAAKVYGFATMPPSVTLHPRQMEIIEGCARQIDAARAEGRREGLREAACWHDAEYSALSRRTQALGRFASHHDDARMREHTIAASTFRALIDEQREVDKYVKNIEEKIRKGTAKQPIKQFCP